MTTAATEIHILLNGQRQAVPRGMTVAEVVRRQNLPADQVAVEINRRLVRSAAYDRLLEEGDEVEIVTFVGGG